jgi:hypothetical protein
MTNVVWRSEKKTRRPAVAKAMAGGREDGRTGCFRTGTRRGDGVCTVLPDWHPATPYLKRGNSWSKGERKAGNFPAIPAFPAFDRLWRIFFMNEILPVTTKQPGNEAGTARNGKVGEVFTRIPLIDANWGPFTEAFPRGPRKGNEGSIFGTLWKASTPIEGEVFPHGHQPQRSRKKEWGRRTRTFNIRLRTSIRKGGALSPWPGPSS